MTWNIAGIITLTKFAFSLQNMPNDTSLVKVLDKVLFKLKHYAISFFSWKLEQLWKA